MRMISLSTRMIQAVFGCAFLASCGPCGANTVRHIDLSTVPKSQLADDEKLFKANMEKPRAISVRVTLSKLKQHPHEALVFERLGYVRHSGRDLVMTKLGSSIALNDGGYREPEYEFFLVPPQRVGTVHFTWETEETVCNEGHENIRTYGWDEKIGPLTPLGSALFKTRSLFIGSYANGYEERPRIWQKNGVSLHEIFSFDPAPALRNPVTIDGEALDFKWSEGFADLTQRPD
jgi:hypothetical protein